LSLPLAEKIITLQRIANNQDATFGVLKDGDIPFAVTLEPPWLDNAQFISCIPAATYTCKSVNSTRFGYTFEIADVPDRTHILFHKGNTTRNTKGCVMVGEKFEGLGIQESVEGYKEFMFRLKDYQSFTLEIKG
jgi:hypothetical protein